MLVSLCVTASGCARSPEVVAATPPEVSVSEPLARRVGEFFEATGQSVAV